MKLHDAKFADHWRHVYQRQYSTRFAQISFGNLSCFFDDTVTFSGGLNAIVGGNGVGKSTLAAAIAELLSSGRNVATGHRDRLMGSTTSGIVFVDNQEIKLGMREDENGNRNFSGTPFEGEFRWLDPSSLANLFVNQIYRDQNFDDLLQSITPLELNRDELAIVSYIVGKDYSSVRIYEISEYADFERTPYFLVTAAGTEYGSETMGRGELSMLFSYWAVKDLGKNSILVLEEPETHVSPRSQNCLMNVLAKCSDEKGVWMIVTTHSPTVISHIPREHVKLLLRENGPSYLAHKATNVAIIQLLGGGVAFRGAFLVEDEGSKAFLLGVLSEIASDLAPQYEVVVTRSESRITAALEAMPLMRRGFQMFGIYDGDMRSKVSRMELEWPVLTLPGDTSPDTFLKAMAQSGNFRSSIASALHKTEEQLKFALSLVAGMDSHDFMREFADALQLEISFVRRNLLHVWLQQEDNAEGAKLLIDELRKLINSS